MGPKITAKQHQENPEVKPPWWTTRILELEKELHEARAVIHFVGICARENKCPNCESRVKTWIYNDDQKNKVLR